MDGLPADLETLCHALVLTEQAIADDSENGELREVLAVLQAQVVALAGATATTAAAPSTNNQEADIFYSESDSDSCGSLDDDDDDVEEDDDEEAAAAQRARSRASLQQSFVSGGSAPSSSSSASAVTPLCDSSASRTAVAVLDADFLAWERHTRGIGSRLLRAMGYKEGEGLGATRDGIAQPIQAAGAERHQRHRGHRAAALSRLGLGHQLEAPATSTGAAADGRAPSKTKRGGRNRKRHASEPSLAAEGLGPSTGSAASPSVFSFLNRQIGREPGGSTAAVAAEDDASSLSAARLGPLSTLGGNGDFTWSARHVPASKAAEQPARRGTTLSAVQQRMQHLQQSEALTERLAHLEQRYERNKKRDAAEAQRIQAELHATRAALSRVEQQRSQLHSRTKQTTDREKLLKKF